MLPPPPARNNIAAPTSLQPNVPSISDDNPMPTDILTNVMIDPNADETPHAAAVPPNEPNNNFSPPSSPIDNDFLSDNSLSNQESDNEAPFYIGQQFTSLEAYKTSVMTYANQRQYEIRYRNNTNFRANKSYNVTYRRFNCARAGKPPKKDLGLKPSARPGRQSLKCDCKWYINATNPIVDGTRDFSVLEICGLNLSHTNPCKGGVDTHMNYALNKRSGLRKYADHVLDHLRTEVKSRRYATKDVQGWLTECGYEGVSYVEATNVRYRLLNDLPFKSYVKPPLLNKDLLKIISIILI